MKPLALLHLWFDDAQSGAMNMAIDQALLHVATVPILRVYAWDEPTISIGYSLKAEALRESLPPWPIVQRSTGGGVVHHDGGELTYSLVVPRGAPFANLRPVEAYRAVHEAICEALFLAGQGACHLAAEADCSPGQVCFEAPALHDVILDGRKIAGAAQRRTKHGILQQGSVRTAARREKFFGLMAKALAKVVMERSAPPRVISRASALLAG